MVHNLAICDIFFGIGFKILEMTEKLGQITANKLTKGQLTAKKMTNIIKNRSPGQTLSVVLFLAKLPPP